MALVASQARAVASNWVTFATDAAGHTYAIETNSIRKGIDGLVYFDDSDDGGVGDTYFNDAVDCQRRVEYFVGVSGGAEAPGWRGNGKAVASGSIGEAELKWVCAKAGSGPLPGHWVGIGFGQSIDKDSIRRGSDGRVHFTSFGDADHLTMAEAADCQQRLIYFGEDIAGSRELGLPVAPGSFAEAELNYACANAG
jgi:hypothetical protein